MKLTFLAYISTYNFSLSKHPEYNHCSKLVSWYSTVSGAGDAVGWGRGRGAHKSQVRRF